MRTSGSRRGLLKAAAASTVGFAAGAVLGFPNVLGKRRRAPRENIILVVCDAMRADVVARAVNGREITPNINRLAREGVTFSNAYSAAPGTKFSMASIFSGMYPPGHGVEHPCFTLPDCLTLAKFLHDRGYYSLAIVTNPYLAPEIGPEGSKRSMGFGFNAWFDCYRSLGIREMARQGAVPQRLRQLVGFPGGEGANRAFRSLMRTHAANFSGGAPLFVYFHYMDSHQPWLKTRPIEGITGSFHPQTGASASEVFEEDAKLILRLLFGRERPRELTAQDLVRLKAVYLEAAAYTDRCVGELLADLKDRRLYDNTTIILTSDHGEELMEHGTVGHGKNLFNTSLRVPLIVKAGRLAPAHIDRRVSNAMILPTVMRWFGEELPATNVEGLQPYMEDPSAGDAEIFASFFGRDKIIMPGGREAMHHEGDRLYFDMNADPGESNPLDEDKEALVALEKARFTSARLAGEAGVVRTYSTYAWQNPDVDAQNRLAQAQVDRGGITPLEAALLKSVGRFLPENLRARRDGEIQIDSSTLTPAQRDQLRALGYLN